MKSICAALLSLLALSSCTTPEAPSAAQQPSPQEELPAYWLKSPALEKTWGPRKGPELQLNGRQAVYYSNPAQRFSHVTIVYEGVQQPRQIITAEGKLASDGKLPIMGQMVDFYGSGNETAEISTQPVQLTTPGGGTAWYSFSFSSKEHLNGKNIPAFTW